MHCLMRVRDLDTVDTLYNFAYNKVVAHFHDLTRYAVMSLGNTKPLAYSYLRYSTPGQSEGDSVRRQTDLRDAWLKKHPEVRLDTSLRMIDAGVSGFKGEHRKNKKHALASFLDLVERGRVTAGSYLIVENLDRLSREHPLKVVGLVAGLVNAGIKVVQLEPENTFTADMDEGTMFMLLCGSIRGHSESKRKSSLCGGAWMEKKKNARDKGTPYGKMCPAWLELAGDRYRVKEDAARAVRMAFELCAAGHGTLGILRRLAAAGVGPIGTGGAWHRSYLKKLLGNVAVLGTYQPMKGSRQRDRVPDGDPIEGYYPAIVSESLWAAAQGAMGRRREDTGKGGRPARRRCLPFSGLLYDALGGSKLQVCGTGRYSYLCPAAAIQRAPGALWRTFPLPSFTEGVLSMLRELSSSSLFADPGAEKVAALQGKLDGVERRLAVALRKFEDDPESPTWADRVSQYDREKRSLVKELAEARMAAAHPLSASWNDAVAAIAADEPERLRSALLETVEGVWCVFVGRGKTRLCACQVWFRGGDQHRDYLIVHRGGTGGAVDGRKGGWTCRSLAPELTAKLRLDLRDREHAARLEKLLLKMEI
jgi:DNA invertase Pin-like site-specific DNA recombinase